MTCLNKSVNCVVDITYLTEAVIRCTCDPELAGFNSVIKFVKTIHIRRKIIGSNLIKLYWKSNYFKVEILSLKIRREQTTIHALCCLVVRVDTLRRCNCNVIKDVTILRLYKEWLFF